MRYQGLWYLLGPLDELQDYAENLKKLFQFLGLMFNLYTVLSCNVYAGTDT